MCRHRWVRVKSRGGASFSLARARLKGRTHAYAYAPQQQRPAAPAPLPHCPTALPPRRAAPPSPPPQAQCVKDDVMLEFNVDDTGADEREVGCCLPPAWLAHWANFTKSQKHLLHEGAP